MHTRYLLPPRRKLRPEPLVNAMAAIAVGMFIGCWVIGPALTHDDDAAAPAASTTQPLSFEAMLARPDPFAYRTPTPTFEDSGPSHYAEAARDKARAEIGRRNADEAWSGLRELPAVDTGPTRWRYRVPDRHAVY